MLDYQDLTYAFDLVNLPKFVLVDIANEIGLPGTNLNVIDLATGIYEKCNKDRRNWSIAIPCAEKYLFAGKTSVCWYNFCCINNQKTILEIITDKIGFNPLQQKNTDIQDANITTSPRIVGGKALSDDNSQYLLRLVFKSCVKRKYNGFTLSSESIPTFVTVIVDEGKKFIEVRGNDKTAKKIESYFGALLKNENEPLERRNIIAHFGNNIERLADILEGNLIETISIPEEILDELKEDQVNAIANILMSLDEYFITGDLTKTEEILQNSRACFYNEAENYLSVPFSAIVLAGMNRLGMAANDELRNQPLYTALQPYLQHQGGFLKFPLAENGVINYYTIKVGLETNTIFFVTPSTEECINYVRNKILLLE